MLFYLKDNDLNEVMDPLIENLRKITLAETDKNEAVKFYIFSNKSFHTLKNAVKTLMNYIIEIYRCYQLHKNEQETIVGPTQQIVILQIILHRLHLEQKSLHEIKNLQSDIIKRKLFDVENKTVGVDKNEIDDKPQDKCSEGNEEFEKIYSNYELFLNHSNMVDWVDVLLVIIREHSNNTELSKQLNSVKNYLVVIGSFDSPIERRIFNLLNIYNTKIYNVTVSISLDMSFNKDLSPEHLNVETNEMTSEELEMNLFEKIVIGSTSSFNTPSTKFDRHKTTISSSSELYAEQLILSYLELLVNSRNELSLATIINVPDRNIDHRSFTNIKHEAAKKGLSMYQTILSFITRIRLGGKGYAPLPDNLLTNHAKGLSEFIDVFNKLHSILEEDLKLKSATTRLINIIKNCLLKPSLTSMTSAVLKKSIVDAAGANVSRIFDMQIKIVDVVNADDVTPTRGIGEGASQNGRRSLRLIRNVLDFYSSFSYHHGVDDEGITITDTVLTQTSNTPIRVVPSLASKFRTPDEVEGVPKKKKLQEKTNKAPTVEEENVFKLNSRLKKHSTTISEQEHKNSALPRVYSLPNDTKSDAKRDSSRLTPIKECKPSKKLKLDNVDKTKIEKKPKKSMASSIKQIQGQSKLNSFFR